MRDVSVEFAARVSSEAQARAWVRARTRRARENFSVLSVFVPRDLRDDFAAVYAFCRVSDDLADETGSDAAARARSAAMLHAWREMLVEAHGRSRAGARGGDGGREGGDGGDGGEGRASHPIMRALEGACGRHDLPLALFTDLLDAFEEDQRVTRWPSLAELCRYSTRSANPVGRLVLGLYGVASEASERMAGSKQSRPLWEASDALCTALQLTNFWQDVRRDLLERDRVYVPCAEIGIASGQLEAWIRGPRDEGARRAFARAMEGPHVATRELFAKGRAVVDLAPTRARRVLSLFHQGGVQTLERVMEARGGELWERPRLSRAGKAWLMVREVLGIGGVAMPARRDVARA